jgi:hydrogenase maturation protease
MDSRPVAVFGLGNVLLSDDSFGPFVIRELLANWRFPDEVVVEDLGTPGLELSTHLAGYDTVILVDAVAADAPVGTIRVYDREAILKHPTGIRLGPHDPSLAETILTLQLSDDGPASVVLIGAVPASTAPGLGLHPELRSAATRVAELIVDALATFGHPPTRIENVVVSAPWWESSVETAVWSTR